MKVRLATCRMLPEPDGDHAPLVQALVEAGFEPELLAWDAPGADWDSPLPTVIRSTWNYSLEVDAFLGWIDRVSASGPLFNPAAVCRANVRKRYLLELNERGVPIVPTMLVERGQAADLRAIGAERIVIKPEVGAGSRNAALFSASDPEARVHLERLTSIGAALLQPYVESVEGYGERAIVAIDGELTHAVRKTRRLAGDQEKITGPFAIADDERAVAEAALQPYRSLLYGRVDLARDASGRPMVMELELVEPSLFFEHGPGTAALFAAALRRRLSSHE